MKATRILVPLLAGAGLWLFASANAAAPAAEPTMQGESEAEMAVSTASSACADCHEDQFDAFVANPHAVLDLPGWSAEGSCVSCHGDGEQHIDEGGGEGTIFAFGLDELASTKTDACLSCHGDAHPRFLSTPHAAAGLSCSDCHSIHSAPAASARLLQPAERSAAAGPAAQLGEVSASCADCHGDVLAQFALNERHRLQEGILDCGSCHNPHEPPTLLALGGFKDGTCVECHADKSGPYVFEHGSVRVEGCTACHTPHGSVNRHMLTFQRTAEVCFSCHNQVPGFHSRFTLETVCTNCHSSIHGSNFDPAFLK